MISPEVIVDGQVGSGPAVLEPTGSRPGARLNVEALANGRGGLQSARPKNDIKVVFDFFRQEDGPSLSVEEIEALAA